MKTIVMNKTNTSAEHARHTLIHGIQHNRRRITSMAAKALVWCIPSHWTLFSSVWHSMSGSSFCRLTFVFVKNHIQVVFLSPTMLCVLLVRQVVRRKLKRPAIFQKRRFFKPISIYNNILNDEWGAAEANWRHEATFIKILHNGKWARMQIDVAICFEVCIVPCFPFVIFKIVSLHRRYTDRVVLVNMTKFILRI